MPLYHTDIFIPTDLKLPKGTIFLNYSRHAKRAAISDRYGHIPLPDAINLSDYKVIEVEVIEDEVTKVLYRGQLDEERDLCIVLIPSSSFVKTVWVNLRSDTHRTLDTSKYVKD